MPLRHTDGRGRAEVLNRPSHDHTSHGATKLWSLCSMASNFRVSSQRSHKPATAQLPGGCMYLFVHRYYTAGPSTGPLWSDMTFADVSGFFNFPSDVSTATGHGGQRPRLLHQPPRGHLLETRIAAPFCGPPAARLLPK